MTMPKKNPEPIDALDTIDNVFELFLGVPAKRKVKREDILSGDFLKFGE